jgi:hypothetical protein
LSDRLLVLPRDQIEAVSLVQPGEPQHRQNPLDLVVRELPNDAPLTERSPVHDTTLDFLRI